MGAMKTSSVEFISRSPNPLPMKNSPLVSMEIPLRTAYGQNGRCDMQPNQAVFARRRIKVKAELKLKKERLLRKTWN
ncbi:hypothetical protein TNCV_550461 [Trichonephila clavipes]|nr:hypothetical protein TNCV_550461 [Trichonephila clavipes]